MSDCSFGTTKWWKEILCFHKDEFTHSSNNGKWTNERFSISYWIRASSLGKITEYRYENTWSKSTKRHIKKWSILFTWWGCPGQVLKCDSERTEGVKVTGSDVILYCRCSGPWPRRWWCLCNCSQSFTCNWVTWFHEHVYTLLICVFKSTRVQNRLHTEYPSGSQVKPERRDHYNRDASSSVLGSVTFKSITHYSITAINK